MDGNPQDDHVFKLNNINEEGDNEDMEDVLGASVSSSRSSRATNMPLNIRSLLHRDEEIPLTDDQDSHNTEESSGDDVQRRPLLDSLIRGESSSQDGTSSLLPGGLVRVRKTAKDVRRKRRKGEETLPTPMSTTPRRRSWLHVCLLWFCRNNSRTVQSTISCMNLLARLLFWSTIVALVATVFWYSYELHEHGYVVIL
jgi:hypothetical protein